MECPKCGKQMQAAGTIERTLVWYSSPVGHDHDDNCRTRLYSCSCGFSIKVSKRNTCPACDWKGKTTCFCHPGEKVDEWPE